MSTDNNETKLSVEDNEKTIEKLGSRIILIFEKNCLNVIKTYSFNIKSINLFF